MTTMATKGYLMICINLHWRILTILMVRGKAKSIKGC